MTDKLPPPQIDVDDTADDESQGFEIAPPPAMPQSPTPPDTTSASATPAPVAAVWPDDYAKPILARLRKDVAPLIKAFVTKRNEYYALLREMDEKGLTRGAAQRRYKQIAREIGNHLSVDEAAAKVAEMNRLKNIPHEAIRHARTLLFQKFNELEAPLDELFNAVYVRLDAYEAEAIAEETKLFKKFKMPREATAVSRRIQHVRGAAEAEHARYAATIDQAQVARSLLPHYDMSGFNRLFGQEND